MPDSTGSASPPDPARGVFLGDLAHDLSTPLTAIHGATELLLAGAYGPLDGEQRALMLEVLASARELRAIVQDVADLGALDDRTARVRVGARGRRRPSSASCASTVRRHRGQASASRSRSTRTLDGARRRATSAGCVRSSRRSSATR